MSATTGANREANPDEFLPTPDRCVKAILNYLPLGGTILEPCAGDGAICESLIDAGVDSDDIVAMELSLERCAKVRELGVDVENCDALTEGRHWDEGHALIIMNPPFSRAREFFERAIQAQRPHGGTVATLLRLGWMAHRADFHAANPTDVYVFDKRPSFVASVKCKARKTGCLYRETLPLTSDRPKVCPDCGSGVDVSASDSSEYAWFVSSPGRGGRWEVLS